MGVPELIVILLAAVIGIGGTIFWIMMLIECATKESDVGDTKLVWIVIIAVTHIIGAAIYFFVRRPVRYAELHR